MFGCDGAGGSIICRLSGFFVGQVGEFVGVERELKFAGRFSSGWCVEFGVGRCGVGRLKFVFESFCIGVYCGCCLHFVRSSWRSRLVWFVCRVLWKICGEKSREFVVDPASCIGELSFGCYDDDFPGSFGAFDLGAP